MIPFSLFLPDSPGWHAANGRISEMREAVVYFHGSEDIVDQIVEDAKTLQNSDASSKCGWWQEYHELFTLKPLRKPVLISVSILCSAGISDVLNYYLTTFLLDVGFPYSIATYCALGMKMSSLPAFVLCLLTIDRMGRRPLLLIGCFGSFVCWSLMAVFKALKSGIPRTLMTNTGCLKTDSVL